MLRLLRCAGVFVSELVMACYKPLQAFQDIAGQIHFVERTGPDLVRQLLLPCGQCVGCKLERARQWSMRIMHEAALSDRNCFVTLTYSDEFLPHRGFLVYKDFQDFMKRLRFHLKSPVRFYMVGEYGTISKRPHYHACLFGVDFDDKTYWRTSDSGSKCYRSSSLERLWTQGNSELGALTPASAAYTARYCMAKVTGFNSKWYYARQDSAGRYMLPPEFNKMSLKPGIGAGFYDRFKADIYPHDYCVVGGRKTKPAKFYDRRYAKEHPQEFEDIQFRRELRGRALYLDNTERRLADKEIVAQARLSQFQRKEI